MILTFAQHGSINSIQAANIWILSDIFVSYLFFFLQFIYWFIFDILNIVDGSSVQRTVVCGEQTFEKETWSTFGRSYHSSSNRSEDVSLKTCLPDKMSANPRNFSQGLVFTKNLLFYEWWLLLGQTMFSSFGEISWWQFCWSRLTHLCRGQFFCRLEKKGNHRGLTKNCKFSRTKFQPWRDQIIKSGHGQTSQLSPTSSKNLWTLLAWERIMSKANQMINSTLIRNVIIAISALNM